MQEHADRDAVLSAFCDPYQVAAALNLSKGARRQSNGLLVRCPAHGDKGPSLSITRGDSGTLRVRCFGACDLRGDVLDLVAAVYGLSLPRDFPQAIEKARDLSGVYYVAPTLPEYTPKQPHLDGATFDAIAQAILRRSPIVGDVARYLDSRGILRAAIVDKWGGLPSVTRNLIDALAREFTREQLERSGLFTPRKDDPRMLRFVRFHHRLLIPWRDQNGVITTLQRRDIRPDHLRGEDESKYVFPRGRFPLAPYGVDSIKGQPRPLVIVEGAVDVLAARTLAKDAPDVIGIPGVSSWDIVRPFCDGRLVKLAFDADQAGDKAANDARATLEQHATLERVRPIDGAKDWAEVLTRRASP